MAQIRTDLTHFRFATLPDIINVIYYRPSHLSRIAKNCLFYCVFNAYRPLKVSSDSRSRVILADISVQGRKLNKAKIRPSRLGVPNDFPFCHIVHCASIRVNNPQLLPAQIIGLLLLHLHIHILQIINFFKL